MVEMILACVIIGAVMTAAAVTGVLDRRRRRADRREAAAHDHTFGEPIPGGWMAANSMQGLGGGGDSGGGGD